MVKRRTDCWKACLSMPRRRPSSALPGAGKMEWARRMRMRWMRCSACWCACKLREVSALETFRRLRYDVMRRPGADSRMYADLGADLPEAERRKIAAKAVEEVMGQL